MLRVTTMRSSCGYCIPSTSARMKVMASSTSLTFCFLLRPPPAIPPTIVLTLLEVRQSKGSSSLGGDSERHDGASVASHFSYRFWRNQPKHPRQMSFSISSRSCTHSSVMAMVTMIETLCQLHHSDAICILLALSSYPLTYIKTWARGAFRGVQWSNLFDGGMVECLVGPESLDQGSPNHAVPASSARTEPDQWQTSTVRYQKMIPRLDNKKIKNRSELVPNRAEPLVRIGSNRFSIFFIISWVGRGR